MTTFNTFRRRAAAISLTLAILRGQSAKAADTPAVPAPPAPAPAPQTAGIELELPPLTSSDETVVAPPAQAPTPAPAPATVPASPVTPPAPPAPVAPTFAGAQLASAAMSFGVTLKADHVDGVYRLGERLKVEFTSERPAHLYLLYHQADGVTKLLFPNRVHTNPSVGEGAPVTLPAEGEEFRFRIGMPLGKETLQVLASVQPIAELEQIDRPTDRAPIVEPKVLEALSARIKADPALWSEQHVAIETVPGVGL